MNIEQYWKQSGLHGSYEAWSFGEDADGLAQLVKAGIKTATSSLVIFYALEKKRLPSAGDHSIILDHRGRPVCIIETTKVTVIPFCEVSCEHAYKEGEGDRSLAYWCRAHQESFTGALAEIGRTFTTDLKVVCEAFRVVYA